MAVSDSESFNPYAALQIDSGLVDLYRQTDKEIREQFIDCEANVKTIGALLILGGAVSAGLVVVLAVFAHVQNGAAFAALFAFLTILAVGQLTVGFGVYRFRQWARSPAAIICALWMLAFPAGTVLGGVSLWYLVRPAAQYVFTNDYKQIISRTPSVKFRTSSVTWALLAFVLVGLGTLVFAALILG